MISGPRSKIGINCASRSGGNGSPRSKNLSARPRSATLFRGFRGPPASKFQRSVFSLARYHVASRAPHPEHIDLRLGDAPSQFNQFRGSGVTRDPFRHGLDFGRKSGIRQHRDSQTVSACVSCGHSKARSGLRARAAEAVGSVGAQLAITGHIPPCREPIDAFYVDDIVIVEIRHVGALDVPGSRQLHPGVGQGFWSRGTIVLGSWLLFLRLGRLRIVLLSFVFAVGDETMVGFRYLLILRLPGGFDTGMMFSKLPFDDVLGHLPKPGREAIASPIDFAAGA